MHRIERDPLCLGWNQVDHDLPKPATERPLRIAVDEIHEFKCQDSTQKMQTMTKFI